MLQTRGLTTAATPNQTDVQIIRRSDSPAALNLEQIRSVVDWACGGLDANPMTLEARLTNRLRNGVTIREIQAQLINCAVEMCSPSEPDWRYVAGRLQLWGWSQSLQVSRGSQYGDYCRIVRAKVESNQYDQRLLTYSAAELLEAGSWINPDWDTNYDYAGAVLLTNRYLLADELPQEAFLTCALLLAVIEAPASRMVWARRFYSALAQRKISLSTPLLANLRIPNGSLSSCFIVTMDDNLESILDTVKDVARISKNGGGVGVNVSRVRATGSWVMGKPKTSGGVIPWIKLLNDTALAVNQGGRRPGAVTVSLDVWHLDVPHFLEMQTENGDRRRKAYDIFPQLVLPDEFMRRVMAQEEWTLVDPYEVRTQLGIELAQLWGEEFEKAYQRIEQNLGQEIALYQTVNARELFKRIMRDQLETGMPYLWFKDAANRANPNQHQGYIPGGNLCQENWSNVVPGREVHTCNLLSLNLAQINEPELPGLCSLAVRLLDNSIDLTHPPFQTSQIHKEKYRTIGVGVMGLADWLARRQLSYSDLPEISHLFENIGYYCTQTSMKLAQERGAYPAFSGSEWSQGKLIGAKPVEWFKQHAQEPERWRQLSLDIKQQGIRNSHITAIAPNTSSSLVQGCTAGVLPAYSRFFYDKWAQGVVPIAPPLIKERFRFYQENKTLEPKKIVQAVATIQQWIDTGISMELLFNLNPGVYFPEQPERSLKAKDIFETLVMAWQEGCKAIYYVRLVQRDSFQEEDCTGCAN